MAVMNEANIVDNGEKQESSEMDQRKTEFFREMVEKSETAAIPESEKQEEKIEQDTGKAKSKEDSIMPAVKAAAETSQARIFIGKEPVTACFFVYVDEAGVIILKDSKQLTYYGVPEIQEVIRLLNLKEICLSMKMSIPTRRKLDFYIEKAKSFNRESERFTINLGKLRQSLIRFHLKEITVDGEPLSLEFMKDGSLSDSSWEVLETLHPTLIEELMKGYEQLSQIQV